LVALRILYKFEEVLSQPDVPALEAVWD
jgi:hypothetical protein